MRCWSQVQACVHWYRQTFNTTSVSRWMWIEPFEICIFLLSWIPVYIPWQRVQIWMANGKCETLREGIFLVLNLKKKFETPRQVCEQTWGCADTLPKSKINWTVIFWDPYSLEGPFPSFSKKSKSSLAVLWSDKIFTDNRAHWQPCTIQRTHRFPRVALLILLCIYRISTCYFESGSIESRPNLE